MVALHVTCCPRAAAALVPTGLGSAWRKRCMCIDVVFLGQDSTAHVGLPSEPKWLYMCAGTGVRVPTFLCSSVWWWPRASHPALGNAGSTVEPESCHTSTRPRVRDRRSETVSPGPCKIPLLQTRKEAPLVTQTTCPCCPGPRSGLTRHSADGLHDKVRKRQVGLPDSFLSVVAGAGLRYHGEE